MVPKDLNMDLGTMLYDLIYSRGKAKPSFFHAKLERGVLTIPEYLWEEKDVSSYHSHSLGGGKSIYWSILEARETMHVLFSGLPVASCLAVEQERWKTALLDS
jgi:hypothetical protein